MNKHWIMKINLTGFGAILALVLMAGCSPNSPVNACHATGDPANPYQEISINSTNLNEHLGHPNDFYPVPVGGCPTAPLDVVDKKIAICHVTGSETNPYEEINVSVNGLDGHGTHEGDLIPAPESGCPTSLFESNNGKITICHATNSEKNPYNEITVSINGLNGHGNHEGDIIPAPAGGCPDTWVDKEKGNDKNNGSGKVKK